VPHLAGNYLCSSSNPYWLFFSQLISRQVRYGVFTHSVFIFFALLTNILVGSQLLLGGSAVVTSLTGMNVYAAIFLIPVGVCVYVVLGGLRATFLCKLCVELSGLELRILLGDYSHTLILMIIILYFLFSAYTTNAQIGSPSEMYELLKAAAIKRPVAGNQDGSYLTLKSNFALVFGVIQLCSGSGTVFLDQAYWQRGKSSKWSCQCRHSLTTGSAIASRPTTAVRAYILGGQYPPCLDKPPSTHLFWRAGLVCHSIWFCNDAWLDGGRFDGFALLPNVPESIISITSDIRTGCIDRCHRTPWERRRRCSTNRAFHGGDVLCLCWTYRSVFDIDLRYLQNLHQEDRPAFPANIRLACHDLCFWAYYGCVCVHLEWNWYWSWMAGRNELIKYDRVPADLAL